MPSDAIGYQLWCVRSRCDADQVLGWTSHGLRLVMAPEVCGGAVRCAAWASLDVIERWLNEAMETRVA
jgi:hypothetical protein